MARKHVDMSDDVVKAIDNVAGKRERSRFLQEAATERLERLALAESLELTGGIASGSAYGHWRDRPAAAAWVRKMRRSESTA